MSRTFDFTSAVSDEREPKGGWCKGGYTCVCKTCGSSYFGDKRSYSCANCAYSAPTPHTDGNGWQEIASAPKDGTEIVAHDAKTKTSHVTHWNGYGWHDPDSHYYSEAPDFEPTLWFPLPPVSTPKAEGESE